MTRLLRGRRLNRVLRICGISLCLVAVFAPTSPLVLATEQQQATTNAPSASPKASAAPAQQQLPESLAKDVADCETSIRVALQTMNSISLIAAAIPKAEHVLQIRIDHQGDRWWQTIDARQDLADLRRISAMPADERAKLAAAVRAADQIQAKESPPNAGNDALLDTLLATSRTEKQILGENHRWYAETLFHLGRAYDSQYRYAEAESCYRQAQDIHRKILSEEHPAYAADLLALAGLSYSTNHYDHAEALYLEALAIQKKTLGDEHSDYATTLDNLATLYVAMGRNDQAETLYLQALEIEKNNLGKDHPVYAATLCNLGDLYRLMGRFAQAEPLYLQALEIRKKILGEQNPDYARSLDRLAALDDSMGRYKQAEPLYKQAIEIRKQALGEEHPDYARSLNNLALLYKELGRYKESELLYRQALEIRRKVFGDQHRTYASSLDDLAQLYQVMGRYEQAEQLYQQALAIRKNTLGEQHPAYAVNLDNLASLYQEMGRYKEAETLCRQALEIRKKTLGEQHPGYARNLMDLALLFQTMGYYDDAEALYLRAIAIQKKSLGEEHSDYATTLDNLANLYVAMGRNDEAETLYRQALDIERKNLGEDHPVYAATLCNLGDLYRLMARYAQAEPLYVQAREIRKKSLGEQHPDYARSLDRLAALYDSIGRYKKAEPLYKQAIEIRKQALGEEHPDYARSLNNLALLYKEMERYDDSECLYQQALQIRKKVFGDQHRTYASSLDDLAQLYQVMGKYVDAEPLYKQALEIRRKTLGEMHPAYAVNLNNLALLYEEMGRYKEAEALCRQALAIRKATLGEQHPQYAANLKDLAGILAVTNRTREAAALLLESAQLQWQHLVENFPTMSDHQKRQFLTRSQFVQSQELSSLVFQGKDADASDGLRGVLLSKQLLFEVARQESGALLVTVASAPIDWQSLWREREQLRHEYASLALLGLSEGHAQQLEKAAESIPDRLHALALEIEIREQQLRRKNPAYSAQAPLRQVKLEDVTAGLREGDVLLEYVRYRPYDFVTRKWREARYGVFILEGPSGKVAAIDLGTAAEIEEAVGTFRSRMIESISEFGSISPSKINVRRSEAGVDEASLALRALIWQPLESHLIGLKRAYIAPDGMLSLIPFEALARENGSGGWRYLAEDYELIYLGTGRDLGRLTVDAESKRQPSKTAVLVSNPDFDADQTKLAAIVAGVKPPTATIVVARTLAALDSQTMSSTLGLGTTAPGRSRVSLPVSWEQGPVADLNERLTAPVNAQLKRWGWSVTMITGDAAVEEAVLGIQMPQVLQFATHGFVLDRADTSANTWDNPLLRSGLVMAGVNTWPAHHAVSYRSGKEMLTEQQARLRGFSDEQLRVARVEVADGILTAYEVTGMNLRGTELVNLTACETGLGEVTPDGVAGLRRAFSLAGARSLTMSMWEVPAAETAVQISDFYENWFGGDQSSQASQTSQPTSRYEAFRAAQLAALRRAREDHGGAHPFYWAGVVYVDDPGDLPARPTVEFSAGKKQSREVKSARTDMKSY
jgi:tetratricopeptide (TPR) repeat protein